MASCFDISIIDAWNTGAENVTDGSVDDYDFDWGSEETPSCGCCRTCRTCQPVENPSCRCREDCRTCQPVEEPPVDECVTEENGEDYPVVQL
ncbi:hypothetical protein [uncultured Allofournierella sp.]|uniref:hypothetical protein n=1 Tax=uncultured Allofournierella sp. TaxID=1940258 RepID=UPI0025D5B2B3|nr:hypothetical protein [uncultured Fournierella sp.]